MISKQVLIRVLTPLFLLTLLSGCSSSATVITETIRDPVPDTWTVQVQPPSLTGTIGDYIAQCEAAIVQSNSDKQQIREWSSGRR
ncbi:Rz1-like lysis system protein LysC [Aliamphritea hakodatensis]|uniref:Rz1-like lysis system protein LysC n=1 Tax=Aliamphritea hakodatensis TaxID=2895352 RepID=UPI00406BA44C